MLRTPQNKIRTNLCKEGFDLCEKRVLNFVCVELFYFTCIAGTWIPHSVLFRERSLCQHMGVGGEQMLTLLINVGIFHVECRCRKGLIFHSEIDINM